MKAQNHGSTSIQHLAWRKERNSIRGRYSGKDIEKEGLKGLKTKYDRRRLQILK